MSSPPKVDAADDKGDARGGWSGGRLPDFADRVEAGVLANLRMGLPPRVTPSGLLGIPQALAGLGQQGQQVRQGGLGPTDLPEGWVPRKPPPGEPFEWPPPAERIGAGHYLTEEQKEEAKELEKARYSISEEAYADAVRSISARVKMDYPQASSAMHTRLAGHIVLEYGVDLATDMLLYPNAVDPLTGLSKYTTTIRRAIEAGHNYLIDTDPDYKRGAIRVGMRLDPTTDARRLQASEMLLTAIDKAGGARFVDFHALMTTEGIAVGTDIWTNLKDVLSEQIRMEKMGIVEPLTPTEQLNLRQLEVQLAGMERRFALGGASPFEIRTYEEAVRQFEETLAHKRDDLRLRKETLLETIRGRRGEEVLGAARALSEKAGRIIPASDIGKPLPGFEEGGAMSRIAAIHGTPFTPQVQQAMPGGVSQLLRLASGQDLETPAPKEVSPPNEA